MEIYIISIYLNYKTCKEARLFGRELAAAGIGRDASTRRAVAEWATGLDGTKIKGNNRFKARRD